MGSACCKDDAPAYGKDRERLTGPMSREMRKNSDIRTVTDKFLKWERKMPFGTIHIDKMREFI